MRSLHYISAVLLFIVGSLFAIGFAAWASDEWKQAVVSGLLAVVAIAAALSEWSQAKRKKKGGI
jgi:hypothetical protein